MSRRRRMDVHAKRAFDELDRARSASSLVAAEAHLALSELHLMEMKLIGDEPAPPALRLVGGEDAVTPEEESAAAG